jgi:hypothetical protein
MTQSSAEPGGTLNTLIPDVALAGQESQGGPARIRY